MKKPSNKKVISPAAVLTALAARPSATVNIIADDVCTATGLPRTGAVVQKVRHLLHQLEAAGDVHQIGWADRDGSRQGRSAALWALRGGARA